jgi:hypothetical protein
MGSQWKCGCRDAACTQSYWQNTKLQKVREGKLAKERQDKAPAAMLRGFWVLPFCAGEPARLCGLEFGQAQLEDIVVYTVKKSTTSQFPYSDTDLGYLRLTGR